MIKYASILLMGLVLTGCSVKLPMTLTDAQTESNYAITDKTKNYNYPSFASGAGNIYSCRYGIFYLTDEEMLPSRITIFSSLMEQYHKEVLNQKITLLQLDVYHNSRLRMLSGAGEDIGGVVGNSIRAKADSFNTGFTDKNLIIDDLIKNKKVVMDENAVGCDDRNEGEYYQSRITAGHDVMITWLKFTVNNQQYFYRSMYQYQTDEAMNMHKAFNLALHSTFKNILK